MNDVYMLWYGVSLGYTGAQVLWVVMTLMRVAAGMAVIVTMVKTLDGEAPFRDAAVAALLSAGVLGIVAGF